MKVRIEYTVEVSDKYRRALRQHYGEEGLATRQELKEHFRSWGSTLDDDLASSEQEEGWPG